MSYQSRDPRDLIRLSIRIPRKTRQQMQQQARKQDISESEIHRQALELGLNAMQQIRKQGSSA